MKKVYLACSVVGFVVPNFLVLRESIENGNILLYADPMATFSGMFANRISTIFGLDLLLMVLFFGIWTYVDGRRRGITGLPWLWVATMLFGLATTFPLYLYWREDAASPEAA